MVAPPATPQGDGRRGTVLLWADTFTDQFHPEVGKAAVEVLERAGWEVVLRRPVCCGLTWISTGQLDIAKKTLANDSAAARRTSHQGGFVVGLEPSCLAVFRSDAAELLGDDLDAQRLRAQSVTLAELLPDHTPGWTPPRLGGVHGSRRCTATSTPSWAGMPTAAPDEAGATIERLDSGCCGLAGNFGFEAGHLEVSKALRRTGALLPRSERPRPTTSSSPTASAAAPRSTSSTAAAKRRSTSPSCSTAGGNLGYEYPEQAMAVRLEPPRRPALSPGGAAMAAAVLAGAATAVAAAVAIRRRRA